jgi:hypothetical protein
LGQSVTFTAQVTGSGPSGTISFIDGSSPISGCGAQTLVAGAASCTTGSLSAGAHSITAAYAGDSANASSASRALIQTVQAPPTATISAPANNRRFSKGQRVRTSFSCSDGAGGPGLSSCDGSSGTSTHSGGSGHLDTSTPGRHTYTVTARSSDGLIGSATITYTVKPAVPKLRELTLKPDKFLAATSGPAIVARLDTGTTLSYRDTLAAQTSFRVMRCAGAHGSCKRLVLVGKFSHHDRAGLNRLRFTGRLHGHALTPGRYVLQLRATLNGQRSHRATPTFTIVPPPPTCNDPDNDGDCDLPGEI